MRLTPKAIEEGCATAADNVVFRELLQLLGDRRQAHLRPGLPAECLGPREEVTMRASLLAAD
jgi:hypothetical protein